MRMIVAAGLIAASMVPAFADDTGIPSYDVDGACRASIVKQGVEPGSADFRTVYNGCVEMDQGGYNYLKAVWAGIPSGMKTECVGAQRANKAFWLSSIAECVSMRMSMAPDPRPPAHFQR